MRRRAASIRLKASFLNTRHLIMRETINAALLAATKARDARRMEALETAILADMRIADPYA